jgi:hypothetical protein
MGYPSGMANELTPQYVDSEYARCRGNLEQRLQRGLPVNPSPEDVCAYHSAVGEMYRWIGILLLWKQAPPQEIVFALASAARHYLDSFLARPVPGTPGSMRRYNESIPCLVGCALGFCYGGKQAREQIANLRQYHYICPAPSTNEPVAALIEILRKYAEGDVWDSVAIASLIRVIFDLGRVEAFASEFVMPLATGIQAIQSADHVAFSLSVKALDEAYYNDATMGELCGSRDAHMNPYGSLLVRLGLERGMQLSHTLRLVPVDVIVYVYGQEGPKS